MYKSKSQMLTSMPSSIIIYTITCCHPPHIYMYIYISSLFLSFPLLFFLLIFFPLFIPCILLFGRRHENTATHTNKKEKEKIACAHAYRNVCMNNRSTNHKRDKQIDILHATKSKPNFTFCSNLISATF